jgi:hypothetical protein
VRKYGNKYVNKSKQHWSELVKMWEVSSFISEKSELHYNIYWWEAAVMSLTAFEFDIFVVLHSWYKIHEVSTLWTDNIYMAIFRIWNIQIDFYEYLGVYTSKWHDTVYTLENMNSGDYYIPTGFKIWFCSNSGIGWRW